MVTGKDYPACPTDGNPACCLKSLCRLVDEESGEMLPVEYLVRCSHKSGSYDTCLSEEVSVDGYLQFRSPASEPVHLLMSVFRMPLTLAA